MKRYLVLVAFLGPLLVSGCGQPQLVVEAALDGEGGERMALSDMPVRLLPYDRDAIFDSLEAAYPVPEPSIPQEVIDAQQQVQEAQTAWRAAEERWGTVRDSMRILSEQLQQMEGQGLRGTAQYRNSFDRFSTLEAQEQQLNRQQTAAFQRFNELQQQTLATRDSIRVQRELWADEAFADFNQIVMQKLRESGLEELADTTNAQGIADFRVPAGRWWVYARWTLPYDELYWNIPTEVTGDSVAVQIDRSNADVRPIL